MPALAHAAAPQQRAQPAGGGQPGEQHDHEGDMAADQEAQRVQLRAQRLRQRQHDAADQRAPQRAGAADDGRLEGEQQLRGAGIGVEGGAHAEEGPGQPDRDHGDRRGDGIGAPGIDADQPGGVGVFRGGADRPAHRGVAQEQLQAAEQQQRDQEDDDGQLADEDVARPLP